MVSGIGFGELSKLRGEALSLRLSLTDLVQEL